MSVNSSRSPTLYCSAFPNISRNSLVYYNASLSASLFTALLAPFTVTANAFILAAIWKTPSLKTPSYVLLAGLAFTDFFTGLITQPFFAVFRFVGVKTGDGKMYCDAGLVADGFGYYFSSLSAVVITMIAVERWLHMSRRSLPTVRRVVVLYITFAVFLIFLAAGRLYTRFYSNKALGMITILYFLGGSSGIALTAFAYFKVFRIIRRHQNQVQTNRNAIDMKKYKKSINTMLCILVVFVLSYLPSLCLILVSHAFSYHGAPYYVALDVSIAMVNLSSFLNPLLYYCRIKDIRDSVKSIIRKLLFKQTSEQS